MLYEAMFIFPEQLRDKDLDDAITRACEEITKLEGSVQERTIIGRRQFARPMGKKDAGQYVRAIFELEPSKVSTLNARYTLSDEVFRVQIVRAEPTPVGASEDAGGES